MKILKSNLNLLKNYVNEHFLKLILNSSDKREKVVKFIIYIIYILIYINV